MSEDGLGRRSLLSSVGAGSVGIALAGCLNGSSDDESTPSDPTTVEDDEHDLSVAHDVESWDRYDPDWEPPAASPAGTPLEYEVVVENLEIPWDVSFAANGEAFISERPGRIVRYEAGEVEGVAGPDDVIDRATAIDRDENGSDWWAAGGEGGLLGIATHPTYPEPPILYAFYTYEVGDGYANRLVYYDVGADDPGETETTLIEGIAGATVHNGCRLAFGPENYLWVTTGDANINDWEGDADEPVSQDLTRLAGKVLRLEPDGSPAPANPDLGEDADPRIYTYGHRNPQGISFLPDATPVITEHGPGARDEVNVLEAGGNYGWDLARDGDTYPGTDHVRPVVNQGPSGSFAPSGCVFYAGTAVPSLQHRLLVGTLVGQRLKAVTIYPADGGNERPSAEGGRRYDADWMHDEYGAVTHDFFEDDLGRIRHVEAGPDGALYAVTCNRDGRAGEGWPTATDDRLVRIAPAE